MSSGVSRIQDLVRSGRITPAQGALLLEIRWIIQRRREWRMLPWYLKLAKVVGRMITGPDATARWW